ncbi:cation-translocating P-type ATPase [Actinomyces sp. B33]|uniref:HAD-IC family P-type ATPase n=1 Tax=Actinomyces sp. B33 TaxID=2942131 RepID=UPI00233F9BFC|nr:HAD-IC family P-type ATPase [Actinomyces sp. B33]MDC4233264.1 cation-translocating P-type ATPase [Actinomyces sp. B33]
MTTLAAHPLGLTADEVAQRVALGQTNAVEQRSSRSLGSIIRENVLTLFNAILIGAMVLVLVFGHWQDAVFGGVMIINAIVGIVAEWRAKRTLDALAIVDAPHAEARRDGQRVRIGVDEVVLDDVLDLRLGDQICVDGDVLDSTGLEVDESLLTGESRPVRKNPGDRVLAGTSVVAGSGVMRATAVGQDVYAQGISRAARVFQRTRSEIHVSINKVLRVVLALLIPTIALTIWSQTRLAADDATWQHAIVLAVASVVGMIPQGLILLTSMNFALGSATLARRGVLVQELPAVEVLARVDALCVDKTGTLTTGGIRVRRIIPLDGAGPSAVDRALAALTADRANATADAIASALADEDAPARATAPEWSIPFSSARKWAACGDAANAWILGAPEIVLDASTPPGGQALARAQEEASSGARVVALAHTPHAPHEDRPITGTRPMALVVLEEDLRDDAAQTVDYFRRQGVRVRVISGDNPATVGALAAQVGLHGPDGAAPAVCDARLLPDDLLSDEFQAAVLAHDVFGRVTPEQKRAMVQALQAAGHCVAMTGDGVNDALALKDADLGIAMGNGAPATKALAQVVLVDSKFSVLPGVLAEGRRIIANMERVSALFLAKTTYAAIMVLVCAGAGWAYPFLPRHFTYVDVLTIGIPGFFIAMAPNARRYVPGFLRRTLSLAMPAGTALAAACLTAYALVGIGSTPGRTAAVLALTAGALWLLSITARPLVGWRIGLIAVMASGAVLGVFVPVIREFFALAWPAPEQWPLIVGIGASACLLIEGAHRGLHLRGLRAAEAMAATGPEEGGPRP